MCLIWASEALRHVALDPKCYLTRGATPCKPPHGDTPDLPIEGQYPKPTSCNPSTVVPHKFVPLRWPFGPSFWSCGPRWSLTSSSLYGGLLGLHFGFVGLHFGLLGLHFGLLGLHFGLVCLHFCLLGLYSGARMPWKVGIYGLALNPKRQKIGWPPANRQVGGKERS